MPPISDAEFQELLPRIDELAARIAKKLSMNRPTREEFLAEAQGWVFEQIDHFDPAKGDFGGWCYVVLRNLGVTKIREGGRRRDVIDGVRERARLAAEANQRAIPGRADGDDRPQIDAVSTLERHLVGADRIIVAIDCQLLAKLEPGRVSEWLAAADVQAEFPWRQIEAIDDQAERREALAAALGGNVSWLRQRIRRALQKIRDALGGDQT